MVDGMELVVRAAVTLREIDGVGVAESPEDWAETDRVQQEAR